MDLRGGRARTGWDETSRRPGGTASRFAGTAPGVPPGLWWVEMTPQPEVRTPGYIPAALRA